ncbi:amino acid ABC transporter substrate-binding protein [Clostridium sp. YIM B02551]|uniref:amino acid ABC transporter substrate-binding protein n=1 Tax=Clostridium sp. YIM B02551 TaxID=2910679 RepID=UPI001EEA2FD3|nr:amino acid ABC transporter substrate-binding protein [Clostridium sp. YIM B02551]
MKKIALLIGTILIASVGLVACSSKSNEAKSNNLLDSIKKEGVIKIGTEGTYAPYTFHDSTGKLSGFDVEIAQEIAKRIGVKPEFVETKWDGMLAGLDAKRFDIVVNEVGINDERKVKYDFSDPYVTSKALLIVKGDNTSIKSFDDLKGKKAAQTLTSNFGKLAKASGADIVEADGFNQSIDLLTSGRVDATINDSLSYYDLKKQKPDLQVKIAAESKDADQSAVLINKGNKELVDAVNKALADMKSDGTYLEISKKYFNEDVSK